MRTITSLSIAIVSSFICSHCLAQRPSQIPLWVNGAPGSIERRNEVEKEDVGPGKCNVTNIHHPSITPYLVAKNPAKDSIPPTAAILICPGGGHRMLCLGHEGYELGQWFADHGIAAFVLKNRLVKEVGSTYTVDGHAMADTRRALRTIRSMANQSNIDPSKIGVLGFSAGGELAALAAMDSDSGQSDSVDPIERLSSRPDFQVLIYPGSSNRFSVKKGMPPVFIALGAKDGDDISKGMERAYLKLRIDNRKKSVYVLSNSARTTSIASIWLSLPTLIRRPSLQAG